VPVSGCVRLLAVRHIPAGASVYLGPPPFAAARIDEASSKVHAFLHPRKACLEEQQERDSLLDRLPMSVALSADGCAFGPIARTKAHPAGSQQPGAVVFLSDVAAEEFSRLDVD
jgi:hypothetical protein